MSGHVKGRGDGLVAENRRARFDYEVEDTLEAGMVLTGSEVKSLREGRANIAEAYITVQRGELVLINADIPTYAGANRFNHEPRRHRTLLVHRRQIVKFGQAIEREGRTMVPLKLYFNDRGRAKLLVGLAKGRKNPDKRANIKDRDWQRDKARIMKERS